VRAEEALRQARDELEQRVELRTAQLREANEQLTREIAERKQAEGLNTRLGRIVEDSVNEVYVFDSESLRFIQVNRGARENLGYSMEELRALTPLDLKPQYTKQDFEKLVRPLRDGTRDQIAFTTVHRRKDASPYDVEVRLQMPETETQPVFFAVVQDITERKRTEQALRESEEKFRAVVDHSPTKIHIKDLEGRYLLVNKEAEDLFGVSDEDARGRTSLEIFSKEQAEAFRRHDAAVLEANHAIEAEEEWVRDDGVHTFLTVKFPIRDASGKPVAIGAIGTDITERKRAEEALRMSEERLQRSVLDAPIPIMIHAEDGEVLMINQEWTSLTGYTHAEIPTIPAWIELAYGSRGITGQSRERIGTLYGIEEKTGEGDHHITTKSGESKIWDFRSSPLGKLPDGRRFVISMAVDVTERRLAHDQLEQRVEERTAELRAAQADLLRQERLATLGQLTATVSHELRNPLGVIRTSNFIARDGMNGATARVQRALERIDRSVIRCDRIIDELLDFTRISGLEPEPTPIDAWLDVTLKEQALPAGITLRRDFGLADTTVPFDHDRFRRAIINVFDNACQAMTAEVDPGAGPEQAADAGNAVLSVTTQRTNGRVEVIFEDRGPGIPADVLPKIFEPLFSTKGFGVGLGLPVVKQIMDQHGGGIEIDGAEPSGTRVCLWLPAERPIRPQT
jgi:PAS domain S-box-containing protein